MHILLLCLQEINSQLEIGKAFEKAFTAVVLSVVLYIGKLLSSIHVCKPPYILALIFYIPASDNLHFKKKYKLRCRIVANV